eukprot:TRINITY_DN8300_c0_g1_i2.p1 TRINITY_DN8300_c0_g1~~TRINITY_DN8300_c0_g1_i2.p1  ORF type:complete len:320 (+),score=69.41 TRINITY_DN8300_c0_g1_i2:117-1076(+)
MKHLRQGSGSDCENDETCKNNDRGINDECVICLNDFDDDTIVRVLPCVHGFHVKCINSWLSRSILCPYCKFDLKAYAIKSFGLENILTHHVINEPDMDLFEGEPNFTPNELNDENYDNNNDNQVEIEMTPMGNDEDGNIDKNDKEEIAFSLAIPTGVLAGENSPKILLRSIPSSTSISSSLSTNQRRSSIPPSGRHSYNNSPSSHNLNNRITLSASSSSSVKRGLANIPQVPIHTDHLSHSPSSRATTPISIISSSKPANITPISSRTNSGTSHHLRPLIVPLNEIRSTNRFNNSDECSSDVASFGDLEVRNNPPSGGK